MLVSSVAAHDCNKVLFSVFNGVESKHAVCYSKVGYLAEKITFVISYCGFGVVSCVACDGGYLNYVVGRSRKSEIERIRGRAYGVLKEYLTRAVYLNRVRACAVNRIPLNSVCANAYSGRCELGRGIVRPSCKKSGVCVKGGVLGICVCKLVSIVIHTDKPAGEGVALSLGSNNAVKLAVDGRESLGCLCCIVSKVEINRELGSAKVLLNPACVNGYVGFNRICRKVVGGLKSGIQIPTNECMVILFGIGGLSGVFAVKHALCIDCSSAVGVEGNGVINLL